MLKWTASASSQRLHELPATAAATASQRQSRPRPRRERRATIANKENIPIIGSYTSTPMPRMPSLRRNSPLIDICNVTPEAKSPTPTMMTTTPRRLAVRHVQYATTLPRSYEEEYSPSGQYLALRGLVPLDPFVERPRYIAAESLSKRKLDNDLVAVMDPPLPPPQKPQARPRPATPEHSTHMGDQTLDKLIDAILDSACKAEVKKKSRKSFNLRRRTLVKQQLESSYNAVLSPSYAPGDDPASDLSFALLPLPTTPEPATPMRRSQMSTPKPAPASEVAPAAAEERLSNTFCLETPVRPLKRRRGVRRETQQQPAAVVVAVGSCQSPLKRYKVDEHNYFEVGLALPSIYV